MSQLNEVPILVTPKWLPDSKFKILHGPSLLASMLNAISSEGDSGTTCIYDYLVLKFGRMDLLDVITEDVLWKHARIILCNTHLDSYCPHVMEISDSPKSSSSTLVDTNIDRDSCSGINSPISSLLKRFMIYAINRAAATSVCALLSVLTFYYISGSFVQLTQREGLQEADYSFHLTDVVALSTGDDNIQYDNVDRRDTAT
ncbi:hypothetical protein BDQ17DRAFT_1411471 [Cyathus striatus]|nr:hypothetical protein BDQ17DRAFT_1411471 [Cyathus striatus]